MARLQKLLVLLSVILKAQAFNHFAQDDQQIIADKPSTPEVDGRPNVVFILTDDQDLHLDSLSYMPYLKKHLLDQGVFFRRHYCTIALCCPSRVSLWTGKAAHNTNVTDVNPPYGTCLAMDFVHMSTKSWSGGYPKFISQGLNEAWLPVWLQDAGYNTYYTGKLFNAHTVGNYDSPFPKGFTGSSFLLDPFTYQYRNSTFQTNKDPPISYEGNYSTDVLAGKAYGFLEDAVAEKKPFFLTIASNAPHSNVELKPDWFGGNTTEDTIITSPPIPAERHQNLFKDATVPRTPNFNPDKVGHVPLNIICCLNVD
jgi:N-acetylglucosamine-6-sulfatase